LLSGSEKEAPSDYNPPYRLARAYLEKGDLGAARAAIARAEKLAYGPRRAVVLMLDGDIAARAGDKSAAKTAYLQAQEVLQKAPPSNGGRMRLEQLAAKIKKL
jgi:predicted negative regulator of RcsB-dependent stress response